MSLVGWWRLDGNTEDRSGYGNDGSGSPSYVDGKIGEAIQGDGSGITIPLSDSLEKAFTGNQMTLSIWWRQTDHSSSMDWRDIIRFQNSNGNTKRLERGRADSSTNADYWCNIGAGLNGRQLVDYDIGVSSGDWFHLVIRRDGDKFQAWVNGQLNEDETRSNRMDIDSDITVNPANSGSQIDDIRVYDHALSVKEIKQLSRAKVLHYKFDSPDLVGDSSGFGHDGAKRGSINFVEDSKIGSGCYSFDGSDDYIAVRDLFYDSAGQLPELTLSAWFKVSSSTQVIHSWDRSEFWRFGIGGSTGSNALDIGLADDNGVSDISANTDVTDGNWHHGVFVYNKGSVTFYLDGEQDGTASTGGSAIGQNLKRAGFIGDYSETSTFDNTSGGGFNGSMDDVRIYHSALSQSEVEELYKQRASIDSGGNFHSHELNDGIQESFETGSFDEKWDINNATVSNDRSYHGKYSFGSWGDGGLEATMNLEGERKIQSLEYVWKEDGSNTGHVVALNDGNDNVVQESGTENPQWYLNNGSGGRTQINSTSGTNYNVWTLYRFDFDWENGTYDYRMEKLDGSHVETGTADLEDTTGVSYIRFSQGSSLNYYGSANYCRFDRIKINDKSISRNGVLRGAEINEVGPAADSLVGHWKLDGDTRDYSGNGNHGVNNGAKVTSGLGQSAYSFDEGGNGGDGDYIRTDALSGSPNDEITASAWIYPNSSADGRATIIRPDQFYFQHYSDDRLATYWYGWDDTGYHTSTQGSVPTQEWSHVAVTWNDNGEVKFYVNGSLDNTITGVGNGGGNNLDNIRDIGRQGTGNRRFNGKLQDIRIYDRALTPEEIKILYNLTDLRQGQRVIQGSDGTVYTKGEFNELL